MRDLFISSETGGRASDMLSRIIRDISEKIDDSNFSMSYYSNDILSVGIIICCFPDDLRIVGYGKTRKYVCYKNKYADIRLPLPYVEFVNSDYDMKYLMVVKNIIKSIEAIGERCKKSKRAEFNSESMIEYILNKLSIKYDELSNINGVDCDII